MSQSSDISEDKPICLNRESSLHCNILYPDLNIHYIQMSIFIFLFLPVIFFLLKRENNYHTYHEFMMIILCRTHTHACKYTFKYNIQQKQPSLIPLGNMCVQYNYIFKI